MESGPNSPGSTAEGYVEFDAAENALAGVTEDEGQGPPPPKTEVKTGGWADEKPKKGRDRTGAGEDVFDERLTMTEMKGADDHDDEEASSDDGGDDGIPAIPNLDTAEREDLTMQIAEAPRQTVAVTSFNALERGLETSMPFAVTESGIDLKLLTKELSNVDAIMESDETWDFEHLFTEVKSSLQIAQEEEDGDAANTSPEP